MTFIPKARSKQRLPTEDDVPRDDADEDDDTNDAYSTG